MPSWRSFCSLVFILVDVFFRYFVPISFRIILITISRFHPNFPDYVSSLLIPFLFVLVPFHRCHNRFQTLHIQLFIKLYISCGYYYISIFGIPKSIYTYGFLVQRCIISNNQKLRFRWPLNTQLTKCVRSHQ